MPRIYFHLTPQERAVVMTMRDDQCSVRTIAKRLGRSPTSISREIRRNAGLGAYDANLAHLQSAARRVMPRRAPKMESGSVLFQVVRQLSIDSGRPSKFPTY